MFNVIAISTVKFRHNCMKTKISTTEGQLIIDTLRERIDPASRIDIKAAEQGDGWITIQRDEEKITFRETDQTLEDQLCASVASTWLGRHEWPDKYEEALLEVGNINDTQCLDKLSLDADFEKVFITFASYRRKNRLFPQLKVVD